MKTLFVILLGVLFFCVETKAQSIWSKIGTTVVKADQTKSNLDKVKGWLPKRKSRGDSAQKGASIAQSKQAIDSSTAGLNTTIVSITGADFSTLKKLSDNIQACEGVKAAKMKFNSASSTIEVSHQGTTDNLLKLIEETSRDIFTEKNIEGFEDGKIQIRLG